nr:PREDICTED: phosphate carrier protein, mitochondrial-like [Rhinolophus sinicus]
MLRCGLTHAAIVLLDLVKCRMQVDPGKYKGILSGFGVTALDDGLCGLARGWAPTFFGYSMQGLCKFGLYEDFTIRYAELLGQEKVYKRRTSLYLTASASAEFLAHLALEHGHHHMAAVKVCIQTQPGSARSLRAAASNVAGIFCAVVSHPADSIMSVLNKEKGSTALGVLRKLGFGGVWKGLFARIVMIGTLTALAWFIYDSVRVCFKLPRPPVTQALESLKKQK